MDWQPGGLLTLETERLVLRTMAREDVTEAVVSWLADPEVMIGMNLPRRRLTRAQAVRWALGFDNRTGFCLGIHLKNAGQVGFFTLSCDMKNRVAETAVVIGDQAQWGKNLVVEGRTALLNFLFDELNMHKVLGRPHGRNIASIFNYKALGFTCEAILREQSIAVTDHERLDQLVFGILKTEWDARRAARSEKAQ